MPEIDAAAAPKIIGSAYPPPHDEPCKSRHAEKEDEFVYVVSGEVAPVEDEGETVLGAGDSAGWKAGVRKGHHLVNRSGADAVLLTVGTRDDEDHGQYSDVDMQYQPGRYWGRGGVAHEDGTPF